MQIIFKNCNNSSDDHKEWMWDVGVVGTQKSFADLDIPSSLGLLTSSQMSNRLQLVIQGMGACTRTWTLNSGGWGACTNALLTSVMQEERPRGVTMPEAVTNPCWGNVSQSAETSRRDISIIQSAEDYISAFYKAVGNPWLLLWPFLDPCDRGT